MIRRNLKKVGQFGVSYRLIINGSVYHCRCLQLWASDMKHILVGIVNINDEVMAKEALEEAKK